MRNKAPVLLILAATFGAAVCGCTTSDTDDTAAQNAAVKSGLHAGSVTSKDAKHRAAPKAPSEKPQRP